jgi:glycosyltransferase involved in cell wall biosynthesis
VAANHASALVDSGLVEHLVLAVGAWQREMYASLLGPAADKVEFVLADINNSSLARNRWFASEVPLLAKKFSSTLVHYSFPAPVLRKSFPCPVAVTLHDLYPYDLPENFGFPNYYFNRIILRQCLSSVDGIACVSNSTRQRLQQFFPQAAARAAVEVTGNYVRIARGESPASAVADKFSAAPFLLAVAQHRRNKNLDILLGGYARLVHSKNISAQLVVVGAPGPETESLLALARTLNIAQQTTFLHSINDAELTWLYQHCALFAATSSIEGFCLPVAEALLTGARVLCSDIPILRDMAAGQASYFSLQGDAVANLAAAMAAALDRPAGDKALDGRFSDETVLAAYLKLYSRLC